MNKRGKKQHVLKIVYTLVLTTALICSTIAALTNNALGASKQNSSIHTTNAPTAETGFKVAFSENFSSGIMPPTNWELRTTSYETWYIDDTLTKYPNSKPSATVNRSTANNGKQDEWLITPSLNFSKFKEAYLNFYWYTCQYVTSHRLIEFNISVSTDGGINWERVWSFDDSINRWFLDWTWYNYFNYNNSLISLNKYLTQKDVRIAFQYNSTHTEYAPEQYFSIDDIQLLVNGTLFACSPGGPYNVWYPMQYLNPPGYPSGVRFHGDLTNGTAQTKWLWDFGDGNTSPLPYFTIHLYDDPGFYNVTLTCTDNSINPPRIAINYTTLNLFMLPPPKLNITAQKYFSLGIKANFINKAKYNATNVTWTITTEGTLQLIQRIVGNGTFNSVANGTSKTIRSKLFSFGTGLIYVTISVNPENFLGNAKRYLGFKIGPFVSIWKEIQ